MNPPKARGRARSASYKTNTLEKEGKMSTSRKREKSRAKDNARRRRRKRETKKNSEGPQREGEDQTDPPGVQKRLKTRLKKKGGRKSRCCARCSLARNVVEENKASGSWSPKRKTGPASYDPIGSAAGLEEKKGYSTKKNNRLNQRKT